MEANAPTGQVVNDVEQVPGITAKKANRCDLLPVASHKLLLATSAPGTERTARSGAKSAMSEERTLLLTCYSGSARKIQNS